MSTEISESSADISQAAESNGMMPFWMQFFHDAGILASDVENYSILFINHRIQKHMLLDLNKEYLVEMGITAMGDIIAILKQAKALHSKPLREVAQKMMPTSSDTSPSPDAPLQRRLRSAPTSERSTPTLPGRSTPASRIVGHYLGNDPEARLMSDTTPTPPKNRSVSPELAKRLIDTSSEAANRKSSVFSRLGNTTAAQSTVSSAHGRLGFADNKAANFQVTINSTSSQQISDLRGVLKRPATTTCHDTDDTDSVDSACEYAGVLKKSSSTPMKKRKVMRRIRTSSNASSTANAPSEGIFSIRAKPRIPSVKLRLGQKPR